MRTGATMSRPFVLLISLALSAHHAVSHAETQSLKAHIGSTVFESDDDGITLVPLPGGEFSLSASTKGASAWPPPKTPIDRLAIVCDGLEPGKPFKLDGKSFERSSCDVTFTQGTRAYGEKPDAEYSLDKNVTTHFFEVTRASGKVYEGRFRFELKHDDTGVRLLIEQGGFKAEDRQL
jgi:hypothetical protein